MPAQLSYSTITCAPSSPHPCPSLNQVPRLLSGPNGIFSAAIGTIGKQRPKMNYLVSSPSLMDKRTKRPRTLRCDRIARHLFIAADEYCGSATFTMAQLAVSLPCRAVSFLFPLLGDNFHFFPFHPIFGSRSWWRGR